MSLIGHRINISGNVNLHANYRKSSKYSKIVSYDYLQAFVLQGQAINI
jgi:hypothetical protein